MITFFVLLAVLMVLVVVATSWEGWYPARRRRVYDRDVLVDRPTVVRRPTALVEEEVLDEPYPRPVARTRRVVRRRSG